MIADQQRTIATDPFPKNTIYNFSQASLNEIRSNSLVSPKLNQPSILPKQEIPEVSGNIDTNPEIRGINSNSLVSPKLNKPSILSKQEIPGVSGNIAKNSEIVEEAKTPNAVSGKLRDINSNSFVSPQLDKPSILSKQEIPGVSDNIDTNPEIRDINSNSFVLPQLNQPSILSKQEIPEVSGNIDTNPEIRDINSNSFVSPQLNKPSILSKQEIPEVSGNIDTNPEIRDINSNSFVSPQLNKPSILSKQEIPEVSGNIVKNPEIVEEAKTPNFVSEKLRDINSNSFVSPQLNKPSILSKQEIPEVSGNIEKNPEVAESTKTPNFVSEKLRDINSNSFVSPQLNKPSILSKQEIPGVSGNIDTNPEIRDINSNSFVSPQLNKPSILSKQEIPEVSGNIDTNPEVVESQKTPNFVSEKLRNINSNSFVLPQLNKPSILSKQEIPGVSGNIDTNPEIRDINSNSFVSPQLNKPSILPKQEIPEVSDNIDTNPEVVESQKTPNFVSEKLRDINSNSFVSPQLNKPSILSKQEIPGVSGNIDTNPEIRDINSNSFVSPQLNKPSILPKQEIPEVSDNIDTNPEVVESQKTPNFVSEKLRDINSNSFVSPQLNKPSILSKQEIPGVSGNIDTNPEIRDINSNSFVSPQLNKPSILPKQEIPEVSDNIDTNPEVVESQKTPNFVSEKLRDINSNSFVSPQLNQPSILSKQEIPEVSGNIAKNSEIVESQKTPNFVSEKLRNINSNSFVLPQLNESSILSKQEIPEVSGNIDTNSEVVESQKTPNFVSEKLRNINSNSFVLPKLNQPSILSKQEIPEVSGNIDTNPEIVEEAKTPNFVSEKLRDINSNSFVSPQLNESSILSKQEIPEVSGNIAKNPEIVEEAKTPNFVSEKLRDINSNSFVSPQLNESSILSKQEIPEVSGNIDTNPEIVEEAKTPNFVSEKLRDINSNSFVSPQLNESSILSKQEIPEVSGNIAKNPEIVESTKTPNFVSEKLRDINSNSLVSPKLNKPSILSKQEIPEVSDNIDTNPEVAESTKTPNFVSEKLRDINSNSLVSPKLNKPSILPKQEIPEVSDNIDTNPEVVESQKTPNFVSEKLRNINSNSLVSPKLNKPSILPKQEIPGVSGNIAKNPEVVESQKTPNFVSEKLRNINSNSLVSPKLNKPSILPKQEIPGVSGNIAKNPEANTQLLPSVGLASSQSLSPEIQVAETGKRRSLSSLDQTETTSPVHINIGRIKIETATPPKPKRSFRRPCPSLSLQDYLARRRRG